MTDEEIIKQVTNIGVELLSRLRVSDLEMREHYEVFRILAEAAKRNEMAIAKTIAALDRKVLELQQLVVAIDK